MNTEKVQSEVKNICKSIRISKYFNRNTNASKKQIARLTKLGLIGMMENWRTASGMNYHQAAAVIASADDAGSATSAWTYGSDDAEIIKTDPSTLYMLLQEANEITSMRHVITLGLSEKGMFNNSAEIKQFLENETNGQPGCYTVFEYIGHGNIKNPVSGLKWIEANS